MTLGQRVEWHDARSAGAAYGVRRKVVAMSTEVVAFTEDDARTIAHGIGLNWGLVRFTVEDFLKGLNVELEHGTRDPRTNVTDDNPEATGRIAWAHLNEFPDYYDRLAIMEREAEAYWEASDLL